MIRYLLAALALATPAAAQTPSLTLKNVGPVQAEKDGQPAPKSIAEWWARYRALHISTAMY